MLKEGENWEWVQGIVAQFMKSPANDMGFDEPEPAFGAALVGIAKGDDPLWQVYKDVAIGACHWSPLEAFNLGLPGVEVKAEDLRIISYILPQTEQTRADNKQATRHPARRWAMSKGRGEGQVNNGLRKLLIEEIQNRGAMAVAPVLLSEWKWEESEKYTLVSRWSERHAAHVAGLGTFGLSDGLITPVGKAVRIGSVVTNLALPVSVREYTTSHEYCLYYSKNGACKRCLERCPVQSITLQGRNKRVCREHCYDECTKYIIENYGIECDACGLCQTDVPCSAGIPGR